MLGRFTVEAVALKMTSEVIRARSGRVSKPRWRNRLLRKAEQLRALAGRAAARYWEQTWVCRREVGAGIQKEERGSGGTRSGQPYSELQVP